MLLLNMLKRIALLYCITIIGVTSIDAQERVGIGTLAPVTKLDVFGVGNLPSIPGSTSTGVLRIGINSIEGIDIGKMGNFPYAGWIQSGYNGFIADPLTLQPLGVLLPELSYCLRAMLFDNSPSLVHNTMLTTDSFQILHEARSPFSFL